MGEQFFYRKGEELGPVSISKLCSVAAGMEKEKEGDGMGLLIRRESGEDWKMFGSDQSVLRFYQKFIQKLNQPNKSKKNAVPKWKKELYRCSVYVQGLPPDISIQEIKEHFGTAGSIRDEFGTDDPRIKIYREESGLCKGDALVTYEIELSVPMAIEVLDHSQIRPDHAIRVHRAELSESTKSKQSKRKLDLAKLNLFKVKQRKKQIEKFSYIEDDERTVGLRIVILKNMFDTDEMHNLDEKDLLAFEKDIGIECQRIGGPIEKITIFKENPQGVIAIKFQSPVGADRCIEAMQGRWYNGRKVDCDYFDGITNYKKRETDEDEQKRLEEFGKWIEQNNH